MSGLSCGPYACEYSQAQGLLCGGTVPHFSCRKHFCEYVVRATAKGGSYERQVRAADGRVLKESGQLPCMRFPGRTSPFARLACGAAVLYMRCTFAYGGWLREHPRPL